MKNAIMALAFTVVPAVIARSDVVSYECDSIPPVFGWTTVADFCDPQQWIEDGKLIQQVGQCDQIPGEGQQLDYSFSLAQFDMELEFFITWRIYAEGEASEIPFVAPAAIAAGGNGSALYHFVIARDEVRFVRDVGGPPPLFFPIAPDTLHTFWLEIQGGDSYTLYVDGNIIDKGVPAGPFPAFQPAVNIRAKSHLLDNTVTWDFIRWGRTPENASLDFNTDGQVDEFETPFFAECMLGPGLDAGPGCRWADTNADTDVDCADRDAFIAAWTGANDPPPLAACLGPAAPIPAVSHWGAAVASLMMLIAGSLVFRHRLPVVAHR